MAAALTNKGLAVFIHCRKYVGDRLLFAFS